LLLTFFSFLALGVGSRSGGGGGGVGVLTGIGGDSGISGVACKLTLGFKIKLPLQHELRCF